MTRGWKIVATKVKRPNILVFLSDDHGQWASSPYGNGELVTPTLDHLARSGARMANAFTPCPVCSPARASFHTGRIPSAHGIHDHIGEQNLGVGHPGIAGQVSLAEVLQGQGYQTGLVGKWHLNHFQQAPPGWETWFSNATGTNARFGAQPFYESGRSLRDMEDDEHRRASIARRPSLSDQGSRRVELFGNQAHHLADRAVRFLRDRDRDRPFYLFAGFTNTHTPHTGEPERWVARYRECSFADLPAMAPSRAHGRLRFHYPTDAGERREANAQYYAAVSVIDEMAGRVLDELANQQAERDTLVVYTSDHGHMNGHHGLHTKGNATTPQNFLEESIRIPCLLSWPGRIRAASVHSQPVDHCDLFMTLADAAGCDCAELAQTLGRAGRSCLPLLSESAAVADAAARAWRDAQVCEYGNARMIRTARHKLIKRYLGPNGHFPDELYDLAEDPDEEHNRHGDPACAAAVAELTARLEAHFSRHEDPARSGLRVADLPIHNTIEPWRENCSG